MSPADADFAPHREMAAAAGFRAVQSTPLTDYAGRLIGMVSTHFVRPYQPPARDLRIMELYGDFAGEAVARRLGVPAGDGLSEPVGQAVISALLDPGDGHALHAAVRPGPADGQRAREGLPGHGHQPESLEGVMSRFAGDVVNRLYSAGLSLESARSIVGDGPAGDRVAAATDELDQTIRDIRAIMFSLVADREQRPAGSAADRWTLPARGHDGLPPARS